MLHIINATSLVNISHIHHPFHHHPAMNHPLLHAMCPLFVSLCDSIQTYSVTVPAAAVWQPDQLHFDDAGACLALQLQLMASTSKGKQWGLWPLKALAHPILHIPPLPITPSVSSMWFLLSSTYMLYFLVFFFCDDVTNWECYCESAIIFCGPQTPPVPFNRSLPVHELWCIYQNNICFLKIVVNGFQVTGKAQFYLSF